MNNLKLFLLTALLTASAGIPINAQLKVLKNGQVMTGTSVKPITLPPSPATDANRSPERDTLSSLDVWSRTNGGTGGYISFGPRNAATIGHEPNGLVGSMRITANFRNRFYIGSENVMTLGAGSVKTSVDISSPAFITTSDLRLKTDSKPIGALADGLSDLTPVSYRLIKTPLSVQQEAEITKLQPSEEASEFSAKAAYAERRRQYGFIAQEVKEIYPELVVEDENGWLGIDYNGFIPLLVDAVKDLRIEVKDLREQLDSQPLTPKKQRMAGTSATDSDKLQSASLSQNRPNPFNVETVVECFIPEDCLEAAMYIYDMQGKQLQKLPCQDRGHVEIHIAASSLAPGIYLYSLITDGEATDTKRMIITD